VATDVNGDGTPDLVVTNYASNDVSVLINDGVWQKTAWVALPSAPHADGLVFHCDTRPATYPWNAAVSDYGALGNVDQALQDQGFIAAAPPLPPKPNGVLVKDVGRRIGDILDGTSQTIMIAEDSGRPRHYRTQHTDVSDEYTLQNYGGGWADWDNGFQLHGSSPDGTMSPGPCAINCTNDNGMYSFHVGGANVLFADASVRYLKDNVPISIVAALVTRAGGEVVSDDSY
jgi:prepilin-type processing-associated H-X9-DG protein